MTRFGKFRKASVALALVSGFGATGSAHADVVATSVLQVSNLLFKTTSGVQLDISSFTNPIIQDSGTNTAALTGFATVSIPGSVLGGGPMDIAQACVGLVCPGQNNFSHTPISPALPAAGTQLTRADSLLNGSPVSGVPSATLGGNASTIAQVLLTRAGVGNGDSDLGLNTLFSFTTTQAQAINLSFSADHYLRSFLSADLAFGSSAAATSKLTFSLVDASGIEVFFWAPDGTVNAIRGGTEIADGGNLNTSRTALAPGVDFSVDLAGLQFFSANTNVFGAGRYQFVISQVVGADGTQIQRVPEPGTMLMAGVGLLGVVLSRRRAKKVA